ncbi:flagellin [Mobiluncus mulieris]|uniref:Flagellin n=1 Tax=Mobiluncus mulieris TaxID=2052 RepID=A0A8G2M6N0_9ACTO|nr:flagellin [Mobiluncus mulieris]MBB5846950.1 flagellin [Mobiluncus mulieris]STO16594.1 B-type flagellin [Mobiluncus mulieris]
MSLSINQNIMAMNSYRNLSVTQGGLAKSLEKLSSGFRINRAADDAAGLAISEGLRSQVGGNRQAVRNAQDGISLVQTAEGALNEVHSILQRMRVLAVQGATDSNSPDARANINTELSQLQQELDRIGKVTNFNGTNLLDGSASGNQALKFQVGANGTENDRITVDLKDCDVTHVAKFNIEAPVSKVAKASADGLTKGKYTLNIEGKTLEFELKDGKLTKADISKALEDAMKKANFEGYIAGGDQEVTNAAPVELSKKPAAGTYKFTIGGVEHTLDVKAGDAEQSSIIDRINAQLKGTGYDLTYDKATKLITLKADDNVKDVQKDFKLEVPATVVDTTGAAGPKTATVFEGKIGINHGKGFKFEVEDGKITFSRADGKNMEVKLDHSMVKAADAAPGTGDKAVELKALTSTGAVLANVSDYTENVTNAYLTVKDHDSAQKLIDVLDGKIRSVSTARSNLGAIQNRFEHTITNLNVAVENLAASESRIRDTDMAQEMMQFTRNQILSQAGTSMLAQANQVPQGVLSLLR